jgi:ABC-type Zn uptake system ZnuABC Zn-binding protein ZnuA
MSTVDTTLSALHEAIADELLSRVRSGEAKPADIANAIKFLKDNNVDAVITDESPMKNLLDNLPFDQVNLTSH